MIDPDDIAAVLEEVEFLVERVDYSARRAIFVIVATAPINGGDAPQNPNPNGAKPRNTDVRADIAALLKGDIDAILDPRIDLGAGTALAGLIEDGEEI